MERPCETKRTNQGLSVLKDEVRIYTTQAAARPRIHVMSDKPHSLGIFGNLLCIYKLHGILLLFPCSAASPELGVSSNLVVDLYACSSYQFIL